jgi:hypothetical protein
MAPLIFTSKQFLQLVQQALCDVGAFSTKRHHTNETSQSNQVILIGIED